MIRSLFFSLLRTIRALRMHATCRLAFASALLIVLAAVIPITSPRAHAAQSGATVPTTAAASGAVPNDVRYGTILDYSGTDVLISQGGFAATSTYDCAVATMACGHVPNSQTSLLPAALTSLATSSSYIVSPDYAYALITTYIPGASPKVTLNAVNGDSLAVQATLPALNGLITNVRWSPADAVLILSESDGSTQKYTVSTGKLASLTSVLPPSSWVTVSPDGRYVAYYIPNTMTSPKRTFGVLDTMNDKIYAFTEPETYWDLLSEGVREFAFSPDSTKLLYLDDRSGYQTLYEVSLGALSRTTTAAAATAALQGTRITSKPYAIADMQWLTNSSIIFSANRANPLDWAFFTLNLATYAISQVTDAASYGYPMQKIGGKVVLQTADAAGRETRVYDPVAHTLSTFMLPGISNTVVASKNRAVTAAGLNGAYLPAAAATSTLVVWLHGGPDREASIDYNSYLSYGGYDWVLNQLQGAGVPVLKLNYPGSVGQTLAFATSVVGGVGTVDASSTAAAIQSFAKAHGYTNVYVMGNSYGGYLALKLLVSYPKQIAGVFSMSGVTDWATLVGNIPSSIFATDFGGPPNAGNAKLYAASSVIDNLSAITDQKIAIVQGDADTEVPYAQSTLLANALTAAGKTFSYSTLQGEDHVYMNASSYTLLCNQAFAMVGLATSTSCVMR